MKLLSSFFEDIVVFSSLICYIYNRTIKGRFRSLIMKAIFCLQAIFDSCQLKYKGSKKEGSIQSDV